MGVKEMGLKEWRRAKNEWDRFYPLVCMHRVPEKNKPL